MNIKSLSEYLSRSISEGIVEDGVLLVGLQKPTFLFNPSIDLIEYTVKREETMRPDLIYQSMYDVEDTEGLDVILYINNIKNPLNIKKGMILKYPADITDLDRFRVSNDANTIESKENTKKRLSFPNKQTRTDKGRKEYVDNGYSLPPVVLNKPRNPVTVVDGNISVGGI